MSNALALPVLTFITGLFMLAVLLTTPNLAAVNKPYGVNIPLSYVHAPELKQANRVFTLWTVATSLPLILGASLLAVLSQLNGLVALTLLPFLQLAGTAYAIAQARTVVADLKERGKWYAGVETGKTFNIKVSQGSPLSMPTGWFVASLLLVALWALALALRYPQLPDPYPVHFNAAGEADGWAAKTVWSVFMPLSSALFTLGTVWLCGWFVAHQMNGQAKPGEAKLAGLSAKPPQNLDLLSDALGVSAADYQGLRTKVAAQKTLHSLGLLAFTLTLGIGLLDLSAMITLPGWFQAAKLWIFLTLVLGATLLVSLAGVKATRSLDRGVLALAQAGAVDPTELELPDESDNIKYGIFYYNRDNPNIMVPKHIGVGYSPNWAHPASWVFGIIFLVIVVSSILLPFLLAG